MLSRRHDNTPIVSDKGDDGIFPEEKKERPDGALELAYVWSRARICEGGMKADRGHHVMRMLWEVLALAADIVSGLL